MLKGCFLLSIKYTALPSLCAKIERAFPLLCFLVIFLISAFALGLPLKNITAASENAHFKCALPILAPEVYSGPHVKTDFQFFLVTYFKNNNPVESQKYMAKIFFLCILFKNHGKGFR